MRVQQIRDLIMTVDENARHYDATAEIQDRKNFTVWMEYEAITFYADDGEAEQGWRFEVNRFTTEEYDPMAEQLRELLANSEGVTLNSYRVQYNQQVGYIRHIYDCEGC